MPSLGTTPYVYNLTVGIYTNMIINENQMNIKKQIYLTF